MKHSTKTLRGDCESTHDLSAQPLVENCSHADYSLSDDKDLFKTDKENKRFEINTTTMKKTRGAADFFYTS